MTTPTTAPLPHPVPDVSSASAASPSSPSSPSPANPANPANPASPASPTGSETTQRLRRLDHAHVWHPFTQMRDWLASDPLVITAAEGNRLVDSDGASYLDGVSSLWTNVHGHRHPKLDAAIRAQLDRVAHTTLLGLGSGPSIELAARLVAVAPEGLTRVFYSDSGSTAVEVALKIAFQFHRQAPARLGGDVRRTRLLSLRNAYHGDTVGAVALGGMDLFHAIYAPLLFDTVKAQSPNCYRCPFGREENACDRECIRHMEDTFARHGHELCAAVVEPLVQGAAGMLLQPHGWLRRVRELCDEHGVFLVADEVATGFGKTGTMFACEQEGVTPDFLCLAKGISGGYLPLAATLATERVHDGFLARHEDFRTFFHGHTYTGNPLACAAGIASLDIFEEERVLEKLQPKIARLTARLDGLRQLPHVGHIRQRGVMTGIELVQDRDAKQPYPAAQRIGHRVTLEARRRGVIIRPLGDVMVLMPPLSITDDEIDLLTDATAEAIRAVTEHGATGGLADLPPGTGTQGAA